MLKLPSGEVKALIDRVLDKLSCSQTELADKMSTLGLKVYPEKITRWRRTGHIQQEFHDWLRAQIAEAPQALEKIDRSQPLRLPFSITIPRDSIKMRVDANGDINIEGVLLAILNKEGDNGMD